jgi:hypothetical protein
MRKVSIFSTLLELIVYLLTIGMKPELPKLLILRLARFLCPLLLKNGFPLRFGVCKSPRRPVSEFLGEIENVSPTYRRFGYDTVSAEFYSTPTRANS